MFAALSISSAHVGRMSIRPFGPPRLPLAPQDDTLAPIRLRQYITAGVYRRSDDVARTTGVGAAVEEHEERVERQVGAQVTITKDFSEADLALFMLVMGDAALTADEPLSPDRQHEEAWFLGLRLNAGVEIGALEAEFGRNRIRPALEVASRLAADGLLLFDEGHVRLTSRGRLLSNEVFQEFLGLEAVVPS